MFKLPSSIPVLYTCPLAQNKLTVAQVKIDGNIVAMYKFTDIAEAMGYANPKRIISNFLEQESKVSCDGTQLLDVDAQTCIGVDGTQLEADIQAIPSTAVITEAQAAPVIEVANSACKVTTMVKRGPNLALKFAWKGEGMAQRRQTIFINQPLLFKFVSKSNLISARSFQDWLFGELLPRVMNDGYYIASWAHSRLSGIDTRKAFTSAVKTGVEDGRFSDVAYAKFTAAINKAVLGVEHAERDQLPKDDLERVRELEYTAHGLLAVSESEADFSNKLALYLKRNKL